MSSLSHRTFLSSSLLLAVRFLNRGVGLISMLILARLLTPDDFGIVAIIAVVIQFFDVISAVGTRQYLIQKQKIDRWDLNTAWTINICMKTGLWLILVLTTPIILQAFEKPDLDVGLWVASSILIISMFGNPGIVEYERALDYSKIVRLTIIQKLISFTVVMCFVYFSPTYWALITGNIVSAVVFTIGSYVIQPFRPSLTLKRFKLQFNFSQWVFYRSVFGFIRTQIDTILVSKNFSISELGVFHLVKSLVYMPATDVISPAIEPLLSTFSRVRDDHTDLAFKVRVTFCFVIILVFPIVLYLALFPVYIVNVLLGEQWERAYTLMPFAAPLLLIIAINKIYETICVSLGRVKDLFYYNVVSTVVLTMALLLMIGQALENFILVRSIVHLSVVILFPLYLTRLLNVNFIRVVCLCVPVLLASALSGMLVELFDKQIPATDFSKLLMTASIFFAIYSAMGIIMYGIWLKRVPEYASIYRTVARPVVSKLEKRLKRR